MMFGEVKDAIFARDLHIERKIFFEAMLPIDWKAKVYVVKAFRTRHGLC